MAVKSERFLSFTRVLVLGYLLICKPSTSVVLPKECKDLAWSVLPHVADSTDFTNDKVSTKLPLCLPTFYKQNPLLAEKLEKIFLDDPTKAGPFAALILSIYLTKDVLDPYYKRLPQHLEFIKAYRETLRIILEEKIEPLLKDINEVRYNWEEFHLAKIYKLLIERLEKIHNTLTDMLLKANAEKLKLKGTEGDATFMEIFSLIVIAVATFVAMSISPVLCIFTDVALVIVHCVIILYCDTVKSKSRKMAEELEDLQDETYKYQRKVAAGESYVNSLLIEVYRTGRQQPFFLAK